jgi:RNA polymerase sigma-70 factor (ECF subfamily)
VDATAGTQEFMAERSRLWGLAYRMLGSRTEADDVVQEAWLRWQRADPATITRPAAWLTTVTSHLAIDRLRARQAEAEHYVGPWLPEPIPTSPDDPAELAASITVGFLALLERLEPVERVVLLLADVFDEPFADIATIVGRTPEACRQIATRARRRVQDPDRARGKAVSPQEQRRLADAFGRAAALGDLDALQSLLTPDVVLVSDGGPDRHAARRPVVGRDRVARLVVALARRVAPGASVRGATVNGEPGLVVEQDGRVEDVLVLHCSDAGIEDVFVIVNPEKLHAL